MSYESPVKLFLGEIKHQIDEKMEEVCYTAVIECFPNVDRTELIRALEYDRQQYEQGYRDAVRDKDLVEVVRCENCVHSLSDGWICGGPSFTMPSHPTYPNSFCSDGERRTE